MRLDDGGRYEPSKAQRWTWECWTDYWASVAKIVKERKAQLRVVYNGDMFEGDHHHTSQIISRHPEPSAYIADRVFGVPRALKPAHTFIVRGTETHVGPSGASEEAFARSLKAEKNPDGERWSWWDLPMEANGRLLDFRHHGRMGQRPWTKANVVALLAASIFYEHAAKRLRYPDLAIRSHFHQHADSHDSHPVRVIQTPAWQLKTSYAHKVAAESLADIGGIVVVVEPDGRIDVATKLYRVEERKPWAA